MIEGDKWNVIGLQYGDESYDPNSGYSYDIKIFYLTRDGQIRDIVVGLCKPAVYSKWECLWKEYDRYKDEMISNQAQGVFVFNTRDLGTAELSLHILPMEQFYPYFINKPPHCFHSEDYTTIMDLIDQSVTPPPVGVAHLFYEKIIRDYIPYANLAIDYMREKM